MKRKAGDRNAVYKLRSDVRFRVIAGEAVVLRQDDAEVLMLNEVGARVLELTDGVVSVGGVVGRLEAEFEVPIEQLTADVTGFVAELVEAGVLDRVESPVVGDGG